MSIAVASTATATNRIILLLFLSVEQLYIPRKDCTETSLRHAIVLEETPDWQDRRSGAGH